MDRPIEPSTIKKKKKRNIVLAIASIGVLVFGIILFRKYIEPSITSSQFTSAIAEVGSIENTINASGEVLPEFEEIISSPINAAITQVHLEAGKSVKAGQSILSLDKTAAEADFHKISFQIDSRENEIRKLKLDLEKSFYDIKSNNSIKQLRIGNFKDAVASAQRLYKAGGGTKEDIEQAKLNLKVAELEKQQLENEIKSKQQTMKIEMREAEISLAIQKNELQAFRRKLDLANVLATRDGVVTWVNKNIGASIREGESLARIADLSSYKVAGSLSDHQINKLHTGLSVIVKIGESLLRGLVSNVSPAINNAVVSFEVKLENKHSTLLRPNQKVDVFLVTEVRNHVVRVPNGPAFKGADLQRVFIVKGRNAERREVKIGLSNFDYVEVISGIKAGEHVITSDMEKYMHASKLAIGK